MAVLGMTEGLQGQQQYNTDAGSPTLTLEDAFEFHDTLEMSVD